MSENHPSSDYVDPKESAIRSAALETRPVILAAPRETPTTIVTGLDTLDTLAKIALPQVGEPQQ